METKEYNPTKNQFMDSLSIENMAESNSGDIKTNIIVITKNIPVNLIQNLYFSILRVKASVASGISIKNHKPGYCNQLIQEPEQVKLWSQGNKKRKVKISKNIDDKKNFIFISSNYLIIDLTYRVVTAHLSLKVYQVLDALV